jgi:hypothetical protein
LLDSNRRRSADPTAHKSEDRAPYLVRRSNRTRFLLTTGMFNLIVKDPYSGPPKRRRLDRGLNHSVKVSSNLLRGLDLAASLHRLVTLATSPILPDFHLFVKLHLFASGPPNSLLAVSSLHPNRSARKRSLNQRHRSRKISKSDQRSTPEPIRLTGERTPGSCDGLFTVGFPTGVLGFNTRSTNQLSNSLSGQAKRPPESATNHLQLFKSITRSLALQAQSFDRLRFLQLS